jgi:hypothetical protein
VKGGSFGGEASIVPGVERLAELDMTPGTAQGMRFQIRVREP